MDVHNAVQFDCGICRDCIAYLIGKEQPFCGFCLQHPVVCHVVRFYGNTSCMASLFLACTTGARPLGKYLLLAHDGGWTLQLGWLICWLNSSCHSLRFVAIAVCRYICGEKKGGQFMTVRPSPSHRMCHPMM